MINNARQNGDFSDTTQESQLRGSRISTPLASLEEVTSIMDREVRWFERRVKETIQLEQQQDHPLATEQAVLRFHPRQLNPHSRLDSSDLNNLCDPKRLTC